MNFFKNNIKLIIGFIIGIVIASCATVYAYNYFAKDVNYDRNGTKISVEQALNTLYEKLGTPVTINSSVKKVVNSGEGSESVTVTGLESDSYYLCFVQCRGDKRDISVSNSEIIYNTGRDGTYLDSLYSTFTLYIHTSSTSVTFTIPGTNGLRASCYKISKD